MSGPKINYRKVTEEIGRAIGIEKVLTEAFDRAACSRDWSPRPATEIQLPDLVVRPTSTEEVVKVIQIANKYKVPVIPFAGGTGMGGGVAPVYGGIALETKRLNKVLEVDVENLTVTAQAGITILKLNEELENYGLWFPQDLIRAFCYTVCSGKSLSFFLFWQVFRFSGYM